MRGPPGPARRTRSLRSRLSFDSVQTRLVALFFVIVAAAVGFVYLYVVPQLSSSLTAGRLERLEQSGAKVAQRLGGAEVGVLGRSRLRRRLQAAADDAGARITLIGLPLDAAAFVLADSEQELSALEPRYPVAAEAASSGGVRSGVETVGGVRFGESAIPISKRGRVSEVVVLRIGLDDVDANVALIRRQIVIAGLVAVSAALVAAWFAAGWHTRRLRRLEEAAERVAEGDFGSEIKIDTMDEVGRLAVSLNEMQRRLGRLESARNEFIANASHELRTPVFSISGFMELLDEEDPDPEVRAEFIRTMREQVERLRHLTVDLLDLSKLDAGALPIRLEAVDLIALAEEVTAEFSGRVEQHEATMRVRRPSRSGADRDDRNPFAHADRRRLSQILRILLDNALSHTPPGTMIEITASQTQPTCALTVTDDGPGINPADRPRVFERFFTGDPAGGSGLGLAIARELAVLMGGDLSVNSHRGRTAFTLALARVEPSGAVA